MVAIYEQGYILLGCALFLTVHLTLDNLDKLLKMSLSIGNQATMRETNDLWMHMHLFSVEKDDYVDPVERVRQEIDSLSGSNTSRQQADLERDATVD